MTTEEQARFDRLESLIMMMAKPVLTTQEAASYIGCTSQYIRLLASRREIPHYKKGKHLYFKRNEIEDYLCETKVLTNAELQSHASAYLLKRKSKSLITSAK